MKKEKDTAVLNSKGASILKKILEDKITIHEHLQRGGTFSDIKNKYNFVKPLHTR